MELTDTCKVLLIIVGLVLLVYLVNGNGNNSSVQLPPAEGFKNEHLENVQQSVPTNVVNADNSSNTSGNQQLANKMLSVNSVRNGQYKVANYADGNRDGASNALDAFFAGNAPQDANDNDGFTPMLEGQNDYATYVGTGSGKLSDRDKFNTSSLLPQESNPDWFDDPYESTGIKSPKLITNIYRPQGVNTIQTTLKNPSLDLRGSPPNPKFPVSPWQNSSYEPDTNIRNQALCS